MQIAKNIESALDKIQIVALLAVIPLLTMLLPVTSFQDAYAEPKDKVIFRDSGSSAFAFWHEETPEGSTIDTFLSVVKSSIGTDIFLDRFIVEPDGTFTSQFGHVFTTEEVFDILKKLDTATLSPMEVEVCTLDDETFECSFETLTIEAQWEGIGDLSKSTSKSFFKSEDFKAKFSGTTEFRQATATGSINGSDLGESEFAELQSFKSMEMMSGQL